MYRSRLMSSNWIQNQSAEERQQVDTRCTHRCNAALSKWTNSLVFHACEDNVEHLRERGLRRGLVDEVAAGQVDVIAGPDCEENRALVDLYVRGGHGRQQGLDGEKRKWRVIRQHMSRRWCCCCTCWIITPLPYLCGELKLLMFGSRTPLQDSITAAIQKISSKLKMSTWLIHLNIILCSSLY